MRKLYVLVLQFAPGELAQAPVEYALVISVTVALLLGISGIVLGGLSSFYHEVTSVVCLPIP